MKKIGVFIHTLGGGGAEKVLVDMINGMDPNKFEITLYPLINTGSLLESVSKNVDVIPLIKVPKFILNKHTNDTGTLVKGEDGEISKISKMYMKLWANHGKRISRLLQRKIQKHDLIISYLEGPTNNFISNIDFDCPKIAWVHVDMRVEKKSEAFFKTKQHIRSHFESFDRIIAVSNDVKESVYQYVDKDTQVDVIYNIYNNKTITEKSEQLVSEEFSQYFLEDKINVISVGRLSNQKGYDRLIDAMNILKERNLTAFNKLNIIIVGDGENKSKLNDKIELFDLSSNIALTGFCDNPYKLIKKADCFISSSRTEGYSTVVVESVILGTPVFTTNCSGMKEILNNGELGFIEDNSTEGIVDLLEKISNTDFSGSELQKMTEVGKLKYDTEAQLKVVENYFDEMINRD